MEKRRAIYLGLKMEQATKAPRMTPWWTRSCGFSLASLTGWQAELIWLFGKSKCSLKFGTALPWRIKRILSAAEKAPGRLLAKKRKQTPSSWIKSRQIRTSALQNLQGNKFCEEPFLTRKALTPKPVIWMQVSCLSAFKKSRQSAHSHAEGTFGKGCVKWIYANDWFCFICNPRRVQKGEYIAQRLLES